jgi:hypothetical protein
VSSGQIVFPKILFRYTLRLECNTIFDTPTDDRDSRPKPFGCIDITYAWFVFVSVALSHGAKPAS